MPNLLLSKYIHMYKTGIFTWYLLHITYTETSSQIPLQDHEQYEIATVRVSACFPEQPSLKNEVHCERVL